MITEVTIDELPQVSDLARWYFYQCGLLGEFNKHAFIKSWTTFLSSGIGFIVKRTGEEGIAEAIGVLIYPDPHDGQPAASTMFWYVTQEGESLAGGLLYQKVIEKCKTQGVVRMTIAALFNNRMHRVENFLIHAGFKPIEVHYVKEL